MSFIDEGFTPGPPFASLRHSGKQFMVGPMGSGAPPHEHMEAINALFHGRKRWAIFHPAKKQWASTPALEWFMTPGSLDGALQCVRSASINARSTCKSSPTCHHATKLHRVRSGTGRTFLDSCLDVLS